MALSLKKLQHMKKLSNKDGIIAAAAMDQRGSLQKSLASAKGVAQKDITWDMMSEFKTAVTRILTPHASAILLDPEFGLDAAKARSRLGWRPRLRLNEALAWTIDWARRHGAGESAKSLVLQQIEAYEARGPL